MKRLLLIAIVALGLASCHTVHKTVSEHTAKVDSSVTRSVDTSSSSEQTSDTRELKIKGVHLNIVFGTDTVPETTHFSSPTVQSLHDVIKSVSGNRVPKEINITIDDVSDSSVKTSRKDTTAVKKTETTLLDKITGDYEKKVDRKSTPLAVTILSIIAFILVIAFLVYKFKKNILSLISKL
jgi:hypothetical protein